MCMAALAQKAAAGHLALVEGGLLALLRWRHHMQPRWHPCMLLPERVGARHWAWRVPLGRGISKLRACMLLVLVGLCICMSSTEIKRLQTQSAGLQPLHTG